MKRICVALLTIFIALIAVTSPALAVVKARPRIAPVVSPSPSPSPTPKEMIKVDYEKINPSDGFGYAKKRLKDKIKLFLFSFSPAKKLELYKEILGDRLAELKYVVDKKDWSDHERTSIRYATTAGEITEFVLKNKSLENRTGEISDLLSSHLPVIMDLETNFNDTTAEWRFIKHDEDYLKIYISQLSGR